MSKRLRWGLFSLFAILSLLLSDPAHSQTEEAGLYFPETGHWIVGDFLDVYRAAKSPPLIYGLPITDAFTDPLSGDTIQYFEKARFVLDPTAPPALRVRLSPLGKLLYTPGTPLRRPPGFSGCQKFHETTFEVCYAFLDFFNSNGGVAQFGYPISNFEKHGDTIVQYFQLARFEWHPELLTTQPVKISNLGRDYFDLMEEDPYLLFPNLTNSIHQNVIDMHVRAFVSKSVVPFKGTQELYVIVQDQNRQPIPGAQVKVTLRYPEGTTIDYPLPPTNKDGITSVAIAYNTTRPSLIELLVDASFDSMRRTTRTSFRTWY
jgi:hypothetical protein